MFTSPYTFNQTFINDIANISQVSFAAILGGGIGSICGTIYSLKTQRLLRNTSISSTIPYNNHKYISRLYYKNKEYAILYGVIGAIIGGSSVSYFF